MLAGLRVTKNVFDRDTREIKSIGNVFGDFLANKGLYDEIEISKDNIFELADLIAGYVKIDIYCPKCGERRVFSCEEIPQYWYDDTEERIKKRPLEEEVVFWQRIQEMRNTPSRDVSEKSWTWTSKDMEDDTRVMVFKFSCAMDSSHRLDYVVLTQGNKMKKIGQYPSVADLSFPELKEYRKVMSKEDEKELKRAIGLFASGIGIGSFVYLRRIFERMIMTASQKAIEAGKIQRVDFDNAHMDQKIKMISDDLPKLLVSSPVFYGIVSKGIHELSEEECLEYFPVLKGFIMMILMQWEKVRKEEEEEKKLTASLNKIAGKIK